MSDLRYVLFDCMETLIDMKELPTIRDYAFWAYSGSGVEEYWHTFDNFLKGYIWTKKTLEDRLPEQKEYELSERFKLIADLCFKDDKTEIAGTIAKKLTDNYWSNYISKCFVKDDVNEVIPRLAEKFSLGVVSNFMVDNGIEELLTEHKLFNYFRFTVTSIKEGWRKPNHFIYNTAIKKTGVLPENIVFIGDDYTNDFVGPKSLGLKAILLDRNDKYSGVKERVKDFYEIEDYIHKICR